MRLYKMFAFMRETQKIKIVTIESDESVILYEGLARDLPDKYDSLTLLDLLDSSYFNGVVTFFVSD